MSRGPVPRGGRHPGRGSPGRGHPRPKKRLSQNFLVDKNMARKIADLAQIAPDDPVLEIGAGTGALTGLLVERAEHVHAVEVDRELHARLGVEFEAEPKLSLHLGNVLELRISDLVPERRVVVVGNLPYAITSDLVLWLLDQLPSVRRAVMLMQREVAQRLTAPPGSREAGSLTLLVHYRTEPERLLDVSPGCFRPVPRVMSSLVAFRPRARPPVAPRDEALFFRTIRAAFGERRKTLVNALSAGLHLPRDRSEAAVREAELDPRIRGERLSLQDFCRLADVLTVHLNPSGNVAGPARGPSVSREEDPQA